MRTLARQQGPGTTSSVSRAAAHPGAGHCQAYRLPVPRAHGSVERGLSWPRTPCRGQNKSRPPRGCAPPDAQNAILKQSRKARKVDLFGDAHTPMPRAPFSNQKANKCRPPLGLALPNSQRRVSPGRPDTPPGPCLRGLASCKPIENASYQLNTQLKTS